MQEVARIIGGLRTSVQKKPKAKEARKTTDKLENEETTAVPSSELPPLGIHYSLLWHFAINSFGADKD